MSNHTIVSGLWNLNREGRNFETHYLPRFKEFLKIDSPMILFLPEELHELVWSIRKKENTHIKSFELNDIETIYQPHWNNTQQIRKSAKWLNISGEGGWLKDSPQATLEYYNPIVQSKMFMLHDASIWNSFDTEYFYWLDAGITNTVPVDHLVKNKVLNNLPDHTDPFIFLSYPYKGAGEIHGFDQKAMNEYSKAEVDYVCRGGLFGGHKSILSQVNSTYYSLLTQTLSQGHMGTEESLFTIMSYRQPQMFKRFMLDENGLIVKFTEALLKGKVVTTEVVDDQKPMKKVLTYKDMENVKTNLYILTFNFPKQLRYIVYILREQREWIEKPSITILDNSTIPESKAENRKLCEEFGFEYLDMKGNKGINRGRQRAAEHFDKSGADYMLFFEDDMTINPASERGEVCRNGFRRYVPNLYDIIHKIMMKENFDFLKLSFTEVYMDNHIQCSWYNIPQDLRTKHFPDYDKLPIHGIDPHSPRTKFDTIDVVDGVSYATGEVYYANWPMIVSKEGNRKMFLDTKWDNPFEQTWMSDMYQKTKKGLLKTAVLLASPIFHDRVEYYKPEERREN